MSMQSVRTSAGRLAIVLALAAAPACAERADDPTDRVSEALDQAALDDVNVDYDRDSRILHLRGSVSSQADRQRAAEIAEQAVGTSGRVLNEVTIEGTDDRADDRDGEISDRLDDLVDNDPDLSRMDIDFEVNNGAVAVTGTVATAAQRDRVMQLVKSTAGVTDVANGLEVDPKAQTGSRVAEPDIRPRSNQPADRPRTGEPVNPR